MSTGDAQPKRPLRWWDLGVAAVSLVLLIPGGVGVLSAIGEPGAFSGRFALTLGTLLGFVAVYAVVIRPVLRRAEFELPPLRRDAAALAILVGYTGFAAAVNPSFATLQAVLYPMIWTVTGGWLHRRAVAIAWSAALAAAIGVGSFIAYERLGAASPAWTAGVVAVCSFIFAVFLGIWLTGVYSQSERHRVLAEQLRDSQAEVAALSTESGAAAERERMSRELHDTLTQTLTGLVMLSEQAERALAAGDLERALDRTGRVGAAAREAVTEARALVATTQPLGESGLVASLERVAARMRADAGLDVVCSLAPVELDREQEVVLLRAAQEGLANARRHAGATRVDLVLAAAGPDRVELRVEDNGVGPGNAGAGESGSGFGLSGLADRARALGGEVRFESRLGGGAQLVVSVAGHSAVPDAPRLAERGQQ